MMRRYVVLCSALSVFFCRHVGTEVDEPSRGRRRFLGQGLVSRRQPDVNDHDRHPSLARLAVDHSSDFEAMPRGPSWALRCWLGISAALGVMAAHCAARLLIPQAANEGVASHEMSGHVLDIATHRWGLGIAVGLGVAVAVLLRIPLRLLWSSEAHMTPYRGLLRQTSVRLAAFQVAGFLTMEATEAWLLRGQDAHFQQSSPLLLGVIAQCIAAVLAAAFTVLLTRAVRSFSRSCATPKPAKQTNLFRPVLNSLPHRRAVARGGATLRGPPLAA